MSSGQSSDDQHSEQDRAQAALGAQAAPGALLFPSANSAQVDYWNAAAGATWARFQEQLDRQIEPLGLEAMRLLALSEREHVLDVGCGCGQSSLQLVERVGAAGAVVGVDVSSPMLEVARRRSSAYPPSRLAFLQADAQVADLGIETFDALYSRFGVMFFADPAAAFGNLRRSLKRGGRLGFVCWRPLQDNPWMQVPLQAALPLLPPITPSDPNAPGPFAFADADRVHSILADAGFRAISAHAFDAVIGADGLDQSVELALRVGPLGAALREHPDRKTALAGAVRQALSAHLTPRGVQLGAGVWIVLARNE
jgi:SAM-dependent methyltransferase